MLFSFNQMLLYHQVYKSSMTNILQLVFSVFLYLYKTDMAFSWVRDTSNDLQFLNEAWRGKSSNTLSYKLNPTLQKKIS